MWELSKSGSTISDIALTPLAPHLSGGEKEQGWCQTCISSQLATTAFSKLQRRKEFVLRDQIPSTKKKKHPLDEQGKMAEQPVAEVFTFPTDPAQFENDDRISFSKLDNKYIAVQESDGTEFEFDAQLRRWIPLADEDEEALILQQQSAYGAAASPSDTQFGNGKKRKQDEMEVSAHTGTVHLEPLHDSSSRVLCPYYPPCTMDGWAIKAHRRAQSSNCKTECVWEVARNWRHTDTHRALLQDPDNPTQASSSSSNKRKNKKQAQPKQPPQNRAIYVTGLPLDVTVDEVAEVFSRKCGVIAEEIDSGRPRIKLYNDAEGNFKGDALIVFFKPQSVDMAIMLLDDTHFRYSESGLGSGTMRVQAAESSYKKVQAPQPGEGEGEDKTEDKKEAQQPSIGRGSAGNNSKDREKIIKKTQKLSRKLADWSDDEDVYVPPEQRTSKRDKMVILKHMFTLQELEEDPAALLEIKEDIREECEKLGEVTNVVLYDLEADGVVSIKYKRPESAEACVQTMNGRNFGGQTVEAYIPTGRVKFQKSKDNSNEAGSEED